MTDTYIEFSLRSLRLLMKTFPNLQNTFAINHFNKKASVKEAFCSLGLLEAIMRNRLFLFFYRFM